MKAFIPVLISLILILGFSSCETDFDVNADWQDITVVYGLLDQQDTFTYIKVNKAFLGEGNALFMAQNPDSSYYPFHALEVKMEEYYNGGFTGKTFVFDTVTITNKEAGVFYYPRQVVYMAHTLGQLKMDNTYKLIITNSITGKVVTAETGLIGNLTINKPLYNPGNPITGFNGTIPYTAEWLSARNGKRYELVIRFNYAEKSPDSPDTTYKYIDWSFAPKKAKELSGGEKIELLYNGAAFFGRIQQNIPENPDVKRRIGKVDFLFSVGADELNTYIEVNEPSNSVVMEKPEYTNIQNGIGIFSSRSQKKQSYFLNTESTKTILNMNLSFFD